MGQSKINLTRGKTIVKLTGKKSSDSKESAFKAGDLGLTPGLGRFPGEGNSNQLQYFCLENSTDRGVWWATVHVVSKTQTELQACVLAHTHRVQISLGHSHN